MPERNRPIPDSGQGSEENAPQPLFSLGQIVATPAALEALTQSGQRPEGLLFRHVTGDWGEVPEEDAEENNFSVDHDLRILSNYKLENGQTIWLITEADRSATTFLLPADY